MSRAIRISVGGHEISPRTAPPELPAGGHEISRGHQLRGVTPLPELAWARRTLSPVVAHRPKRGFAAPTGRLSNGAEPSGERGFRQGAYLARARRVLADHLDHGVGGANRPRQAA